MVTRLNERLGRPVAIDRVAVAPYTLEARVQGLRVYERDGRDVFASLDQLDLQADLASMRHLAPVVDALRVQRPRLHVVREDAERFNFSDILEHLASTAPAAATTKEAPVRFSAAGIRVVDGGIDFDDHVTHATHRIAGINLAVPFISNLPTHLRDQVQPTFSATVDGAPFKLDGETLPFDTTLATHFRFDLAGLELPRFAAYAGSLPLALDAGKADARIDVRFSQSAGNHPAIELAGIVRLHDVALSTGGAHWVRFGTLDADIASFDPLALRGNVRSVALKDAQVEAQAWRVAQAEAKNIAVDLVRRDVSVASVSTSGGELALARSADQALALPPVPDFGPSRGPWHIAVRDVALSNYQLALRDDAVHPALARRVTVSKLEAHELSTDHGLAGRADANLQIEGGGEVRASSDFRLDPLEVHAKIDARSIDLVPARAYVATFPAVQLKSGTASASGDLTLRSVDGRLHVAYKGSGQVDRFDTWDSINKEDLLNWKRIRASGVQLEYAPDAPMSLAIADVDVDSAYSRVFVSPQGRLNVQQLMDATANEPAPPPKVGAPTAVKRDIRVDTIRFAHSRLNFTDHYIRPNYSADVHAMHGSVKGLSSDPSSRATVVLEGQWDSSSPVMIAGTVNPLAGDLFLDIGAKGQDIDLTKLSAYSQRYAGYRIAGGALSLDVKYHVENGKLEGRNRILVDHLALGEKVESPDATSLPVAFLINLLKDKDGRINLTLPISGSLDDPKFDVMAVVSQLFSGPLEKAQTSPFSLLAGASSDGSDAKADDLAFVDFAPGQDALTPASTAKLDRLAQLLTDHPGVKLAVAPGPITAQDVQALKAGAVQRALAAAPKDLPKEARAQIAQSVEVSPDDRQALAAHRLQHVREYLAAHAQLPEARIVVSNEAAPTAPGATRDASRVEFALK
jgi:hypothetical protein